MALEAHPAAERGFDAMPDSQKKQMLYWIRSAKRQATRATRITATVEAGGRAPASLSTNARSGTDSLQVREATISS